MNNLLSGEQYIEVKRRIPKIILALALLTGGLLVTSIFPANAEPGSSMPEKSVEKVLKEHTASLMAVPGVVGTAQGLCNNRPCIKVFVKEKTPELEKKIPAQIEGYPVEIEETGEFRALPKK